MMLLHTILIHKHNLKKINKKFNIQRQNIHFVIKCHFTEQKCESKYSELIYLENYKSYKKNSHTLTIGNVPRILHTKSEMSPPSSSQDMAKSGIFAKWPTATSKMAD